MEQEWCQSVTDTTEVFGRINKDLATLDAHLKTVELYCNGFKLTKSIFEDNCTKLLKRVLELESENKKLASKVEDLEMTIAFHDANGHAVNYPLSRQRGTRPNSESQRCQVAGCVIGESVRGVGCAGGR